MAKGQQQKQRPGRPPSANPKTTLINFRVDQRTLDALERQREKMGVISFSLSDTAREIVLRSLKDAGLL